MIKRLVNSILDRRDNKKKEESLINYPWRYEDRHGKRWINVEYRCSWNSLRKWC